MKYEDLRNTNMTTITICSSANFYREVVNVQAQLEKLGFKVLIPASAEKMKISGDFNASKYKVLVGNGDTYGTKADLMQGHFTEIEKADVLLVLNYKKHSIENYIGGNVLIEMGIAFYLQKPIYILNGLPSESLFLDEISGMNPIVLKGNLATLFTHYKES